MNAATSVLEAWARLSLPPAERFAFVTSPLTHLPDVHLGRSVTGPALLFAVQAGDESTVPVELKNLRVSPNLSCRTLSDGVERDGRYTVCMCTSSDAGVQAVFLEAVQMLVAAGSDLAAGSISHVVQGLVELFRSITAPPTTSLLGLWGEVFLVARASDPDALLAAWHQVPNDRYDFGAGSYRLEVKTTVGRRQHKFSLAQVQPPDSLRVVVASLVTAPSAAGVTVRDLVGEVVERCTKSDAWSTLITGVGAALGRDMPGWSSYRFDPAIAASSLQWMPIESVPRPDVQDARVYDVRFTADLADQPAADVEMAGLFAAAQQR